MTEKEKKKKEEEDKKKAAADKKKTGLEGLELDSLKEDPDEL